MSTETPKQSDKNDISNKLVSDLTNLLNSERIKDALNLVKGEEFLSCINECSWDLIPVVSGYLNSYNMKNKLELFQCCETVLEIIANRCDSVETVVEFVEQAECSENDTKFCAILKPMAICLDRLKGSRGRSLEWCINTIKMHVGELPLPENQNLEEEETILLDADPAVFRIVNVYQAILPFFKPFVSELSLVNRGENVNSNRELLIGSLICLLGKPFCYLELGDTKSLRRMLAEDILKSITQLTGDIFRYLKYVEIRMIETSNSSSEVSGDDSIDDNCLSRDYIDSSLDVFASKESISDLAYANLYYLVLGAGLEIESIPRVYHPHYVLHNLLYLSSYLLEKPKYLLTSKGLVLAKAALIRVEAFSVNTDALELKVYISFVRNLSQVMIYCDARDQREMAFKIFKLYFKIFTMEAKYLLILRLYDVFEHSGLLSCLTSIVKDSVVKCLDSDPVDRSFLGKRIRALLTKACKMPFASSSDLVEISDEITASLNLIRYLVIRDKTNVTEIWDLVPKLQTNFLQPLRDGLDISRAHYKLKIKDLEVQEKLNRSKGKHQNNKLDNDINITVGGKNLPTMPITEKINFCRQAIIAFDVMESILIRVNECIENQPILKDCFRGIWTSKAVCADQVQNVAVQDAGSESSGNESDGEYEKNIKSKILNAAMAFVPDLGWSKQAISAGAESVGYPGVIHGMFPNGGADLVQHFYASCNKKLAEQLKSEALSIKDDSSKAKKSPEVYVKDAVETRLRMLAPLKKTWPQAMGLMALPPNVPTALANLLTLVDDICYYAGDRSVDFNWYTRRIVLAGIYKTTELYMLQDNSNDHQQTWQFLERRIEDAAQLHRVLSVAPSPPDFNQAAEAASAAFVTARNILGLNWNR